MIWKSHDEKKRFMGKKLIINRALLYNLVDIVWGDALEDNSVPSSLHSKELIQKAIEQTRHEKYVDRKNLKTS